MASWAILPQFNCNINKTHIINPKTLYMLPRHVYTIDLGVMLTRIPNNTVVIIQDTLPTCKILNTFWIANKLSYRFTNGFPRICNLIIETNYLIYDWM